MVLKKKVKIFFWRRLQTPSAGQGVSSLTCCDDPASPTRINIFTQPALNLHVRSLSNRKISEHLLPMIRCLAFAMLTLVSIPQLKAQYAYGDRWYNNPLGFKPLNLHTSMSFFVPAAAVGICLLVTKNNAALSQRLSVYHEAGPSWGYKYPHTFMLQTNTGVSYQLRRFMAVGTEVSLVFPRDEFNSPKGFAIRPFARFYPVNRSSWKLYFESGGGLIFFNTEFPGSTDQDGRLGTSVNGFTKYGIGTEIRLAGSWALMGGLRHVHISNGNTKGEDRNPSHDSNGFFAGVTYRIKKQAGG